VKFGDMVKAMADGEVPPAPVMQLVGMRITEAEPGRTVFELEAGPQHANPMGTLHGGILADVADAAMGSAYASRLEEGESFTTLELKLNFLRPFWNGLLVATAEVVDAGRTIGLVSCRIVDAHGRLVAYATSTCMTLRGDVVRKEVAGGSP
jgi:uncharacterized protein (TIGR00369 family)